MRKKVYFITSLILLAFVLCACGGGGQNTRDEAYESQVIIIEGLPGGEARISIAELRDLPQHELDANYLRTTGMYENFLMKGPYLADIIAAAGGNLADYEGVGVVGSDAYYCLLSREIIEVTPDLMLAITVDGQNRLDEGIAPAWLAVQGQFGPYWVKMVERIILYTEVPEKNITSVWAFDSLTEGIEPYMFEYYGSKDASIELAQIFSRLDHVDSRSFFTMKSSDGFLKNEIINMVKSRYYIKIEGVDAPTNISPYIRLGMNVQHIAWFSTNADAAIFLDEMMKYMDTEDVSGHQGIPVSEVLYEVGVKTLRGNEFQISGTKGETITVPGEDLFKGILAPGENGSIRVLWQQGSGYDNIDALLRIRMISGPRQGMENENDEADEAGNEDDFLAAYKTKTADTVLTISGASSALYFSLRDLKDMEDGYTEEVYSTLNNWPTKSFAAAKGIDLSYLLSKAGIKSSSGTITVESADGYKATFTHEQLLGAAYRYPNLQTGSAQGAAAVKPVLAWEFRSDTTELSETREDALRLVIGQTGLSNVNTVAMVKQTAVITVSPEAPGRWTQPGFSFEDGLLTIAHEFLDQVKIYYTTDGSNPNINSAVYNPSTTYFQPHLIQPLSISSPVTVKAFAVGNGRFDSEIAVWEM